ncbi:MAG: type II toxin-antitoxin system VapC family toxin [Geminicoccaceae bacterium]
MIILDTNILSALMQTRPDLAVIGWLDDQPASSIWTTAITVFEIAMGLRLLSEGRRRRDLEEAFEHLIVDDLGNRVLPFDQAAARQAGDLAAIRQKKGRPVDIRDTQIAGIALSRKASLATRNIRRFEDVGLTLIEP